MDLENYWETNNRVRKCSVCQLWHPETIDKQYTGYGKTYSFRNLCVDCFSRIDSVFHNL